MVAGGSVDLDFRFIMKNSAYHLLAAIVTLLMISACNSHHPSSTMSADAALDTLLNQYYEERLTYFPLEATGIGDPRYNDRLSIDISESFRAQLKAFYQKYSQRLDSIQRDSLDVEQQMTFDIFRRDMSMNVEGLGFNDHLMPLNQFWGMHLTFPQLGSGEGNQPFKTVKDYDNFLKRIDAFVAYEDTAIANMRRGMKLGVVQNKLLMERVLVQLENIVVTSPEKSVFYGPITHLPDSFPVYDKERLKAAYSAAIMEKIVPVYQRLIQFVRTEYLPVCRDKAGVSAVPGGAELYAFLCRQWNTTNMTPDEIFETGEKEVARIFSEMERVKNETGFKGDMKSFFHFMHTNPKFFPFHTAQEVLDYYESIHQKMKPQLSVLFSHEPKTKFEIRRTEAFREASASAEYQQGSADGSRPGIFYVPVPDPRKANAIGAEDLFLHEAIPGHHYQCSLQQEDTTLPRFRRFGWYGAYGEGWALYSESLGKELGLYSDPYQYFASLSEEMHRAIRLVVDVGMHMKGWTREQAIAYSLERDAESEADITVEIERYMAIPGQATAYKIGQLKILELRHKAEQELGAKFNIRAFHDEVLKGGCLPLEIFEKKMERWIRTQ